MNVEDIKNQILKFADKKTLIRIGIGLGGIIFFLIIYYAVINPIVEKKKTQLNEMNKKKQEISKNLKDIKLMKAKIKKLRPEYENYSSLFHTRAEVEGLYQTLSEFAAQNGLVITRIEKKKIKEVGKSDVLKKKGKKKKKKKKKKNQSKSKKNIAYYLIPVDFEIDGSFIGYIKFKRALSLSNKMLNFDKESISVVKGNTTGAIKVKGTLTIVGLPDEFF